MSEVVVIAVIRAKPGVEEELASLFQELIPQVQAEEGCLLYALHRSLADPTEWLMVERWASREALGEHERRPALRAFGERAGGLLEGAPTVSVYEACPAGSSEKGRI
jgi:quinol monooxygenase YgiN